MEQKNLRDLMDLLATARQQLDEAKCRLVRLQSEPRQMQEDIARLDEEYQPLVQRLEKLTAEQEGEYDALQQQLQALEQEKSGISVFRFKDRGAVSARLRQCRSRCREIEEYRTVYERVCYLDGEMQKLRSAVQSARQEAQTLQQLMGKLEDESTRQTLTCIETLTAMEEEEIRTVAANAPLNWATLPMNLLRMLCAEPRCPLRPHLDLNRKILLNACDHIPFTMGKYRWQTVRLYQDRALLICMDPVYPKTPFREAKGESEWSCSNVRKLLNGEFLQTFSADELAAILYSEETDNRVFALNCQEAEQYLSQEQRAFALCWWLRETLPLRKDLEEERNCAGYIDLDGGAEWVYCHWDKIYYPNLSSRYDFSLCCRPVMWVSFTREADDVMWEKLWRGAKDGVVSCKGKWRSVPSRWVQDYGYSEPRGISSGRRAAAPTAAPDYMDYDPLHKIDYSGM